MADTGRLARLARVREVERRRAAEQAAATGSLHRQLVRLAERSCALADSYAARGDAFDGGGLALLFGFRNEIGILTARAAADAEAAGHRAEHARSALSIARKRSELVDERLQSEREQNLQAGMMAEPNLARSMNERSRRPPQADRKCR